MPARGRPRARRLDVEVVWADIARVRADVHVVGHYRGVVPQFAELALDRAVSGLPGARAGDPRLLITTLAARGSIDGSLGAVNFVPWGREGVVAVCGMGYAGTFQTPELRAMASSVTLAAGRLPGREVVASVLIGSGAGNLSVRDCVGGMLTGVADALDADAHAVIRRLRIVELQLDRALEIQSLLQELTEHDERFRIVRAAGALAEEPGGRIPPTFSYSMLLAALAAGTMARSSKARAVFEQVAARLPKRVSRDELHGELRALARRHPALEQLAMQFRIRRDEPSSSPDVATRVTFSSDGEFVRCAAITDTATVSERQGTKVAYARQAARRLNRPDADEPQPARVERQARNYFRMIVPTAIAAVMQPTRPLVVEVDREMAALQWELLGEAATSGEPLSVAAPMARQLRTTYSVAPATIDRRPIARALVIGDPGAEEDGLSLPACRVEAARVANVLEAAGVDVERAFVPPNADPADYELRRRTEFVEVLALLSSGEFDLVHYCGHAVFSQERPDLTGWVFGEEILNRQALEQMRRPPALVVANACQTAQVSTLARGARESRRDRRGTPAAPSEAGLVAGLADEFFRHGVLDYIGTAWEVPSSPAKAFAERFYAALFGKGGRRRPAVSLGEALADARRALWRRRRTWGAVWGAYQHYGDPTRRVGG